MELAQNSSERSSLRKLKELGISDESIHAIIGALDPYHDVPMARCGWPDARGGRSIVVEMNREITVRNNQGDGGQFLIHMTPFLEPIPMMADSGSNVVQSNGLTNIPGFPIWLFPSGSEAGNYGGLMILNQPQNMGFTIPEIANLLGSSTQSFQLNPFLAETSCAYDISVINAALEVYEGEARCIGVAFDVRNVSPELYKSGSQLMYRLDDAVEKNPGKFVTSFNSSGVSIPNTPVTLATLNPPPSNLADAKIIPGSITRMSKEGTYMVGKMNQVEIQATQNYSADYVTIFDANITQPITAPLSQPVLYSFQNTGIGNGTGGGVGASYGGSGVNFHVGSYNQFGVIHSGLSAQTELTITAKWIIEIFVDPKNSTLYPLTQPAASFQPEALDILTEAFQGMEVGTVVKNAGDGWFSNVMKAVDLAAPVLSMIPQTKALGALATGASGLYKSATSFKDPGSIGVQSGGIQHAAKQIHKKEIKKLKKDPVAALALKKQALAKRIAKAKRK